MATSFREIREGLSPERQERIRTRTEALWPSSPCRSFVTARALSQAELAEVLGLNQATISELERRTDMYLSSLRRFVEAMGGELEISASFPRVEFVSACLRVSKRRGPSRLEGDEQVRDFPRPLQRRAGSVLEGLVAVPRPVVGGGLPCECVAGSSRRGALLAARYAINE